jgi:hypothetical protein
MRGDFVMVVSAGAVVVVVAMVVSAGAVVVVAVVVSAGAVAVAIVMMIVALVMIMMVMMSTLARATIILISRVFRCDVQLVIHLWAP